MDNNNHSSRTHIWLMLLCCLMPIVELTAVFVFKIPASTVVLTGLVLLCPFSHLLMMGMMGKNHTHDERLTVPANTDEQPGHGASHAH